MYGKCCNDLSSPCFSREVLETSWRDENPEICLDGKSSLDALNEALDNVEQLTETILEEYTAALAAGDFAKVEEPSYDFETVNERLWAA